MTLSVVLATFNEEKNIGRCLEAVRRIADEIVIVDGKSSDKTVAIGKKHHAKVILVPNNPENFHLMKKKAINTASSDWILQLDADEVVTTELAEEIKQTIYSNPIENGFWIPRKNYFLGKFLTKGGAYPDYTLRLYRRGKGNLPAKSVHEQAEVSGQTAKLKNPMLHFNNQKFSDYIDKSFNRYTDIMARQVSGGLISNVFIKPVFDSNQGFFSIYFRHLGFLDGFPGFVWALFSALHFPIAFFKHVEHRLN